jgi:putative phosphoribosyl transferase
VARAAGAQRIVVAAPVGSDGAVSRVEGLADAVLCLAVPRSFGAVGAHYLDFSQTPDAEVLRLLAEREARG